MKFFMSVATLFAIVSLTGCKQDLPRPVDIKKQLETTMCTTEVKECNDGSFVSRDPEHSCSFKDCPSLKKE